MNRAGLAKVVSDRMVELKREGINQDDVARLAQCSPSTIRNMQNGIGDSEYEHYTLKRVAKGLGLPDQDRLVKTFYRPVPRDPEPPSDAEVMVQRVMSRLEPYLAKIDAIPGLQERLKAIADDVHEVKSQLEILLELDHTRPGRVARTGPRPDLP